ncbi:phosphoribosylanthranilate isomerase [Ruegeria hyattellae]|uniref:phosphoribosylanthranilate isomerase n=1 Tax=Ruegeria hyattellae TaxID=3233337 RepID=UPI00355B7FF3
MAPSVGVKICGLKQADHVHAAAQAGARYIGLNFFPKSPRFVDPEQARSLAEAVPMGVAKVAVTVKATDEELDRITAAVPLDMLQLHGGESVERVSDVKARYGLPVIKVIGVADAGDFEQIDLFSDVADQFLIEAKPPKDAPMPGGLGLRFDWRLLAGRKYWRKPWMLAGGLTPENVQEAIRMTGATQVDVSSGVETSSGVKDVALIRQFVTAATA